LPIKESLFQLYRSNNLAHEKYLTIVEDEKGIVDNSRVNSRMDKQSVQDNDDGKDVYSMIQRHGSKGTNTYLVVSQSQKDVTANRRRLANKYIEFLIPKDIYLYNFEINFVNFLIRCFKKISKKRSYRILRTLFILDVILKKQRYIVQNALIHFDEEKIGQKLNNSSSQSFLINFTYPADISFSRYNQYSFYDLFDRRNTVANISLAKHSKFKKMVITEKDYATMDYKSINKIYANLSVPTSKDLDKQIGTYAVYEDT
jgi:hypothetical protein